MLLRSAPLWQLYENLNPGATVCFNSEAGQCCQFEVQTFYKIQMSYRPGTHNNAMKCSTTLSHWLQPRCLLLALNTLHQTCVLSTADANRLLLLKHYKNSTGKCTDNNCFISWSFAVSRVTVKSIRTQILRIKTYTNISSVIRSAFDWWKPGLWRLNAQATAEHCQWNIYIIRQPDHAWCLALKYCAGGLYLLIVPQLSWVSACKWDVLY